MRRYGDVDRNIRNIEDKTPKPEPRPPEHPLIHKLEALGSIKTLFALEVADGLMEASLTDFSEAECDGILKTKRNKFGCKKQLLFDFLERRNGKVDDATRNLIIEILQENGKTTLEAETLLHKLHIYLIRQVLDVDRPQLKLVCEDPTHVVHEEFDLDTRFPNSLRNRGPVETRLNEMGPYPSQQELTSRLRKVYAETAQ
jgi:hypothetical protein